MRVVLQPCVRRDSRREAFSCFPVGGSTPKRLYEKLAKRSLPWDQIDWFFGDERNVPHDHEDSNYRMVHEALFGPADIPEDRIHPVPIQPEEPEVAASQYEETLRRVFDLPAAGDVPVFDLVLLGMGDDAHTASLFPHSDAIDVENRLYVENYVPKLAAFRLTETADLINAADNVWFMITGSNKQQALQNVWRGPSNPAEYPSQLVNPSEGILWWMVSDEALGPVE